MLKITRRQWNKENQSCFVIESFCIDIKNINSSTCYVSVVLLKSFTLKIPTAGGKRSKKKLPWFYLAV